MNCKNTLSSRLLIKAVLAFITLTAFTLCSCGKRKPPLPPVERVSQRVEIDGFQRGNQVVLSWRMPARNASDQSILNINRADVYRLADSGNSGQSLSEEEFSARSTLIASLPVKAEDFNLKKFSFSDSLEFANQNISLKYAVRLVNKSGQKAGFSNFLTIEPSPSVAEMPTSLSFGLTEQAINLQWTAPLKNVDGTAPPSISGYNVYRSNSAEEAATLLNAKPLSGTEYSDNKFQFGSQYLYFVRTVSPGANGAQVESGESNIVKVLPKDLFPPSPPSALTIAASPNVLSIFFAVNPEKDIGGYQIYRSEDRSLALSQWTLLTNEKITTNTFQDKNVVAGKKYFYYLRAIDLSGNLSEPSDIISETAL